MPVTAHQQIEKAHSRCLRYAEKDNESPLFYTRLAGHHPRWHVEQIHHGTTDYALAAWHQLRDNFRGQTKAVHGTDVYMVAGFGGARNIQQPALVIENNEKG